MPRGRPRKIPEESGAVYLRLSAAVVAGYERWRDELHETVVGGAAITLQDVMRGVLERALAEHEAERAAAAKPRPKRKGPAKR